MSMVRFGIVVLLFALPAAPADGGTAPRTRTLWNQGWQFLQSNAVSPESLSTAAAQWREISVPHSWNAFDAVDQVPGYHRGGGWYRKPLVLPSGPGARRFVLEFEGANITTRVFVNGTPAGQHTGGYVGFDVELTPLLRQGTNDILVRVDNRYDPHIIPSQRADFFIYGGLFRDVWLLDLPADRLRSVDVHTPQVSHAKAFTVLHIALDTRVASKGRLGVTAELLDPAGRAVNQASMSVPAGEQRIRLTLPDVWSPALWSPDSPSLYTVRVSLQSGTTVVDRLEERFGYRWFEFREQGPFFLNGERLLLRGTHRHEEHAGLGNALPDSLHRRDMQMIKAMGANFVRLAHYPQDPEVYRACDEMGLLVWDELPWCRGGVGDGEWKENTRRLLQEQIGRNRNHPCIILWSLGNEMDWMPEFPGGGNPDSLRFFFRELNTIAHQMDGSRPTSVRKFPPGTGICDVASPSIWAGWYSGAYRDYEQRLTEARPAFPRMFHAEYGGDSHVGRHTEEPVDGDGRIPGAPGRHLRNVSVEGGWDESYIVDLFDWHLHVSESLEWLSGTAQWALKDFGTPLRPENPIPYVNQKGLLDRNGVPKDAYYVFKSVWTTTPAFCYIVSPTWDERYCPAGATRQLRVYSNCRSVELFVNGASAGRRQRDPRRFPAAGLTWDLPFPAGENLVIAAGEGSAGETVRDTVRFRSTPVRSAAPDRLVLSAARGNGGTVLITAVAVDIAGRRCLDYNGRIYFSSLEGGRLLEHYGTPTRSSVIEMANGKAFIEYLPAPGIRGVVEARTHELKGTFLPLK